MGYLALAFLVLPTTCSACQIALVFGSPLLNISMLKARAPFYAFVILMALTNMEAMRVLPWRAGTLLVEASITAQRLRVWGE